MAIDIDSLCIYLFICAVSKTNKCLHAELCVRDGDDDTSLVYAPADSLSHTLDFAQHIKNKKKHREKTKEKKLWNKMKNMKKKK